MKNLNLLDVNLSKPIEYYNIPNKPWNSLINQPDYSFYYMPLFSKEECNEIIKIGLSNTVGFSATFGQKQEGFTDARASKQSWLGPSSPFTNFIFERINKVLLGQVGNHFGFSINCTESLQFTIYDQEYNGFYGPHIDSNFNYTGAPGLIRKLSMSVMLSDPEDYEGGDLNFYFGKDPQNAPKEQGMSVFFPSFNLHEVTPVTKGTRYSLVTWASGPKFI